MAQPQTDLLGLDLMGISLKILKYWPKQNADAAIEAICKLQKKYHVEFYLVLVHIPLFSTFYHRFQMF